MGAYKLIAVLVTGDIIMSHVRTPRARVVGVKEYGMPEVYKVIVEVKDSGYGNYIWQDLNDETYKHDSDARKIAIDWVNGETKTKTRHVGEIIGYEYNDEYNPVRWEKG